MTTVLLTVVGTLIVTFIGSRLTFRNEQTKWLRDQRLTLYVRFAELQESMWKRSVKSNLTFLTFEEALSELQPKLRLLSTQRVLDAFEQVVKQVALGRGYVSPLVERNDSEIVGRHVKAINSAIDNCLTAMAKELQGAPGIAPTRPATTLRGND